MALSHSFSLTLLDTGRTVDVYDRYDVTLDMLKPGSPWTFSLWRSSAADTARDVASRRTAWSELISDVKLGGQILFSIDGAPQLNGVIEDYQVHTDRAGGAKLILSGRDLSANALDWDADPRINLRGSTLDTALTKLFQGVGLTPILGVDADGDRQVRIGRRPGARGASSTRHPRRNNVDLTHPRPGERVWQVAESLCKRLGYLMWVAPCTDGLNQMAVVVDVPNYTQTPLYTFSRPERDGVVPPGSNVLESAYRVQIRDVPFYVYAAGHTERGDKHSSRIRVPWPNNLIAPYQTGTGVPLVATPAPPHPRWINSQRARTVAGAKQEAQRVIAEGMKDFRTYTCTVQGHGQVVNGRMTLYAINTMARVTDVIGGVTFLDEDMLVQRVEFSGSRKEGQTTRLTLGTRGMIALTPEAS